MEHHEPNGPDHRRSTGEILTAFGLAVLLYLLVIYLAAGPFATLTPRWLGTAR